MSPARNLIAWNNWDSNRRLEFLNLSFPAFVGRRAIVEWSELKWYALPEFVISTIKNIRGRMSGAYC